MTIIEEYQWRKSAFACCLPDIRYKLVAELGFLWTGYVCGIETLWLSEKKQVLFYCIISVNYFLFVDKNTQL